jgi:ribosomal protein S18 acetylase RimI-like enzyme
VSEHPLDDPIRTALQGPHAPLAQRRGRAVRYRPDVAPFLALPADGREWDDAAALLGAGGTAVLGTTDVVEPASDWVVERTMPGVRLVAEDVRGAPAPDAVVLGTDDVDAMLALVARTRPGPFLRRTVAMGTYLGIRIDGELVAMAGERLRVPGHTEISAVCTHPDHQGHGLAARLVRDLVGRIHARDETPFLHAVADNTRAIGLYEHLGFRLTARPDFVALRAPDRVTTTAGREHRLDPAR